MAKKADETDEETETDESSDETNVTELDIAVNLVESSLILAQKTTSLAQSITRLMRKMLGPKRECCFCHYDIPGEWSVPLGDVDNHYCHRDGLCVNVRT